jgi:hypothetical protein
LKKLFPNCFHITPDTSKFPFIFRRKYYTSNLSLMILPFPSPLLYGPQGLGLQTGRWWGVPGLSGDLPYGGPSIQFKRALPKKSLCLSFLRLLGDKIVPVFVPKALKLMPTSANQYQS